MMHVTILGLDDTSATMVTTHWGMTEQFRLRYSRVDLKPDRLITDSGDIYTAGGSTSMTWPVWSA